ncbi:MetQ/NlpA family ABC transporter substrate-binding protein [Mollicutes bacterium LVI A0039]|nr:MetQ/NlpA family ABC transporter substrate-binding protein [Mollicutes bacterium LVI A0039]
MKINKKIVSVVLFVGLVLGLSGCSSSSDNKIVVGATSVPHAEILEQAKPLLEEAGYDLEIQVFDDYVLPNKALDNGDLDANYFQHQPYLDSQIEEFGYDFTSVANIHVEPIRVYSKKYTDVSQIPDGAKVLLSNSVSDQARIFALFADAGLITIKDGVDPKFITIDDIESNPKNLVFDADYDAALLSSVYQNGEGDLVAINTNYALAAKIDPNEAVISESDESEYANVLAVRTEDQDSEKTKALVEALTSDEITEFINSNYDGAVIPASN